MTFYVQTSFVNLTREVRFYDSDIEARDAASVGDLYRDLRREFGRCTGRVYVDKREGESWRTRAVGWVFVRREAYDDDPKTKYTREVWVTLWEPPPPVVHRQHAFID